MSFNKIIFLLLDMKYFSKNKKLKILFVASEARPFMKVGGLGEVMYSLPKALRDLGHDARVMIPKYASIDSGKFVFNLEQRDLKVVPATMDQAGLFVCNVLRYDNENRETEAYFLENQEYYEKRANTYGYADDAVRWALLSRGALEFVRQSVWKPDVIVASDWQTGLISNYIHTIYKNDPALSKIAILFSIHNLAYQGMFDHHFVSDMDFDSGQEEIPEFDNPRLLKLNFMRRGIMHADAINTVSSTYAKEITTPEYGELLNDLLKERRSRLFGILNGMNYEDYDPEKDANIKINYGVKSIGLRKGNKIVLQNKFNLEEGENIPVFGIISRLTDQKGFGLFFDTARSLLNNFNFQLVILGSGDANFMSFFQDLINEYPKRVAGHFTYDETLPRFILAGADFILIPSKFEPCGLTQMEAMRYGAVPIVRKTGGLADSVVDYDPEKQTGTGFVFEQFDHYAFFGTIVRALETYKYSKPLEGIQKRAMKADFSWTNSAKEYVELFKKTISLHDQPIA